MERDARGRFVKKGSTKKAAKEATFGVEGKKAVDLINNLVKDLEDNGFTLGGVGIISEECITDDKVCAGKVGECVGGSLLDVMKKLAESGNFIPADKFMKEFKDHSAEDAFFEQLKQAKNKLDADKPKTQAATCKSTPVDWSIANPQWINDLHEIFEESSIPETEEGVRDAIIDAIGDAAKLTLGYMLYLESKALTQPKVSCKCKGKCKK